MPCPQAAGLSAQALATLSPFEINVHIQAQCGPFPQALGDLLCHRPPKPLDIVPRQQQYLIVAMQWCQGSVPTLKHC